MARKKHNDLVAGIFVIFTLAVLIGVIVWMGGADLFRPAKQEVVFFTREEVGSMGLIEGSFVKIGDDQVGTIARIDFVPEAGKTFYYTDIDRGDFKVHSDGKAKVVAGLIGGASLVITNRGSDAKPLADRDDPIELTGGMMDAAMTDLAAAADRLNKAIQKELDATQSTAILAKVHTIIDSLKKAAADVMRIAANVKAETDRTDETAVFAKLHASMDDVNKISSSLRTETDPNVERALLAKVHKSVTDINEMTADARPKLSDTLTAVRDTAQQIRKYTKEDVAELLTNLREVNTEILKMAKDFVTVSSEVKEVVLLHRDNVDEMIDNMVLVSANLKAASKEIRRNPWRLLYKPDEKELHSQNIYEAARDFANGAEQLDQAVAKMTGLAKVHPEGIPSDDPTLLKIRKHLEETFGKFIKVEQALWEELRP